MVYEGCAVLVFGGLHVRNNGLHWAFHHINWAYGLSYACSALDLVMRVSALQNQNLLLDV